MEACRTCNGCGKVKKREEFHVSKRDGWQYKCKACRSKQARERYLKNKDHIGKVCREYRKKNRDKVAAVWRKYAYGLEQEQYLKLLAEQSGSCACCGYIPAKGQRPLAVDHDHATGKVRSLLCDSCNKALGILRDDPERCYKLAEYAAFHGRGFLFEVRQ